MWIIFGVIYIAFMMFLVCKKSKLLYNPAFWMIMAAVLIIGMYYTSGYVYNYPLRVSGLLYYLGVVSCFCVGFFFVVKGKSARSCSSTMKTVQLGLRIKEKIYNSVTKSKVYEWMRNKIYCVSNKLMRTKIYKYVYSKMYWVIENDGYNTFYGKMNRSIYFLITLIGAVVFLVDFFMHNSLASDNLHTGAVNSSIGVLGKICLLFGIVVWLGEVASSIQSNKKISLVGYISAGMYFIPAVLTSGRQSFIIFIVATISIVFYSLNVQKEYRYLKRYVLIGAIGVCAMMVFCVFVATTRQSVSNKAALFEYMFNCVIPEKTESLFLGMGAIGMLFCEIVSYYSHELPMFQVFFDNWNYQPMLGINQIPLISQNINQDSIYSYSTMWENLDRMSEQANVYSHVWRTMSANCITDFGRVGGLLFMIVLGVIVGVVYKSVLANNSMKNQIILAMMNAGAFFSMQFSPLVEGYWYFPMIWLLVAIPIMNYVIKGVIKK